MTRDFRTGRYSPESETPRKTLGAWLGSKMVDAAAPGVDFEPRSGQLTDLAAGTIKSSSDGGQNWIPEPVLNAIATRNGEFAFNCGAPGNPNPTNSDFDRTCPLTAMAFAHDFPDLRFAVLHPGGLAVSRDAGKHWMPLPGVTQPIDRPVSAWCDHTIIPTTKATSLYVALHTRGIIRVDAPFSTIGAIDYEVRGLPENLTIAELVYAVDETFGTRTLLTKQKDGSYRGQELFDTSGVFKVTFHYEAVLSQETFRSVVTTAFSHLLSSLEQSGAPVDLHYHWQM